MPASMASLILRAPARAASSVAWAASRCAKAVAAAAVAARSGSGGGAAASDPLMRAASSVVDAPAAAAVRRSPASSGDVLSHIATLPPPFDGPLFAEPEGWVDFEADEKDLESDEALWALYERWCKHFNEERDHDEMARRFGAFKETVMSVEENKRSDLPYRFGINQFADGKVAELQDRAVRSNSDSDVY